MQTPEPYNPQQSGKNVWHAVEGQAAEIGSFIRSFTAAVFRFIGAHLVSLILAGILGAGLAYAFWLWQPRVYYAEMTVSYQHYEKKIYADMIEKLDQLIQSEDFEALASHLNLPQSMLSQLTSLETFNIKREPLIDDLSTERIPFYIRAGSKAPQVFPALQPALVHYLDDTDYIRKRIEYIDQHNREKLAFYESRLHILDTLKHAIINNPALQTSYEPEAIINLHNESIQLYEKINELKGSIQFNYNIEILNGFIPGSQPDIPALLSFILYGIFFGLAGRLAAFVLFG